MYTHTPEHLLEGGSRRRDTIAIVPTYNERENLPIIVERIWRSEPEVHILVVDDSSPDGTGAVADDLASVAAGRMFVLHRTTKDGLGAAYLAGFSWVLARGYHVVVEVDADGSHPPEQMHRLLDAIEGGADVSIGSRYVAGGEVCNWPRRRLMLSRVANRYAKLMLGVQVNDITAGYRAYRREVLSHIGRSEVDSKGYCFQVELTWRSLLSGFTVVEVPITFAERERGQSKMSASNIWEATTKVGRWGVQRRRASGPWELGDQRSQLKRRPKTTSSMQPAPQDGGPHPQV